MKRYVRCSDDTLNFPIRGTYRTKRGKLYNYKLFKDGSVEVWYNYTTPDLKHGGPTAMAEKSTFLYSIPKEVQQAVQDKYGSQLAELGITLRF